MILKINISDHFPVCLLLPTSTVSEENKATYIAKRMISNDTVESYKQVFLKPVAMISKTTKIQMKPIFF